jgi:hypothetical protein
LFFTNVFFQFVGTVTIGAPDCPPVSVSDISIIKNEKTLLEARAVFAREIRPSESIAMKKKLLIRVVRVNR